MQGPISATIIAQRQTEELHAAESSSV